MRLVLRKQGCEMGIMSRQASRGCNEAILVPARWGQCRIMPQQLITASDVCWSMRPEPLPSLHGRAFARHVAWHQLWPLLACGTPCRPAGLLSGGARLRRPRIDRAHGISVRARQHGCWQEATGLVLPLPLAAGPEMQGAPDMPQSSRHASTEDTTGRGDSRTRALIVARRDALFGVAVVAAVGMQLGDGAGRASASKLPGFADSAWEAMGGGPADLTFPDTWLGVWDVISVLNKVMHAFHAPTAHAPAMALKPATVVPATH